MYIEKSKELLVKICEIGANHPQVPVLYDLFPFRHYFDSANKLKREEIEEIDGLWTRREILARYLLVSSVLDQGPDLEGVRNLLKNVVNSLYEKEIRILHKPLDFFKELNISIDEILEKHESIKMVRAKLWAKENKTTPNKYNLFTDRTKQVLGYAVYRWGVPLSLFHLLEKDLIKNGKSSDEPFVEYIESWDSAEIMSQQIKDNERYGLGKAIGDKAGHLFAKFYLHTFGINKRNDNGFGPLSYELPFDSNAGRVLFRTGFLLEFAELKEYEKWGVIQKEKGKGGKDYIRVTNIRGKNYDKIVSYEVFMNLYNEVIVNHLRVRKRKTRKVEIQRLPNALLFGTGYGIGHLDDGLIYIGTNFCYNHENPKCSGCPVNEFCLAYKRRDLIDNYRT
jgi:hypothetical protein